MPESVPPTPSDELVDLAQRVCDGTISVDERRRLESCLAEAPELRHAYLDYLGLNADLTWRYRTGSAEPEQAPRSSLRPQANVTLPTGMRLTPWTTFLMITACLLVAAWSVSRHGGRIGSGADSAAGARRSLPAAVATIRESSAALWREAAEPLDVGDRVAPGQLSLASGRADIVLDSGVRIVIEGPAELSLLSPDAAFLASGKVAVQVPEKAIGFELSTPASKLIDRGTEFGVVADESGATEVHVFRGQVDLMYRSSQPDQGPEKLPLISQQARRVLAPETMGEDIDFSLERFEGLADIVSEPIAWRLADGGNGHFYQLVFFDRAVSWQQAAADAFSRHHNGLPGHLVTVTSEPEHRFLVEQLLGDRSMQNVWIGLTDVLREGDFQWITGEPFAYEHWQSAPTQQPDNFIERDGHGGEDYGTFTRLPGYDWHWNDLSCDSIHQSVAAALIEYEPPSNPGDARNLLSVPVTWKEPEGGNGHHYRLVLALEPLSWEELKRDAESTSLVGIKGQLASLETQRERDFVEDSILKVCGIPENVIGLAGEERPGGLHWLNGRALGEVDHAAPNFPTEQVYGQYRWLNLAWRLQTVPLNRASPGWFGYLIEYPTTERPQG